ncbi:MAG: nitroreductase, partial [Anaerolineae bacterium]|nr:nitroreductase [Anaerolineae bacterium]
MTDTPDTSAQGIGRTFMEKTKYKYATPSAQQRGETQPPLELPFDANAPLIDLPDADANNIAPVDVYGLITNRQTWRNYTADPMTLSDLSFLLWTTQGIKAFADTYATRRTVPSAGARHAFETYLLVHSIDGLEPGM